MKNTLHAVETESEPRPSDREMLYLGEKDYDHLLINEHDSVDNDGYYVDGEETLY